MEVLEFLVYDGVGYDSGRVVKLLSVWSIILLTSVAVLSWFISAFQECKFSFACGFETLFT